MRDYLYQKIKKVFDENNLIGTYYFNEGEYSEMIDYANHKCWDLLLNRNERYFPRIDYPIFFVILVQIAIHWKNNPKNDILHNDRGFWKYVSKIILGDDVSLDSKLYSAFTNIIFTLGKYQNLPVADSGQKYYATIMMHSFSPQSSIYSFFDLCYNIYKRDLDFGFTTDDLWLCDIVLMQLRNVLDGNYKEDKLVSIGSNAYSINIGLRSFVLNKNLSNEFLEFIKYTFFKINKLFNQETIDEKTRLDHHIIDWWKNKLEGEKLDKNTTFKKRIPTVSKQNITIRYQKRDDEVYLCVPSIRLEDNTNTMQLSIFVEGEKVYCHEMSTKHGELVFATKPIEFELNKLLQYSKFINIKIEIEESETIIFQSEKNKSTSLCREFILFDGEQEVFSQINKPTNYFLFSKDIDSLKETPEDLTTCGKNLYNIYPTAGETIIGKTKQVFFINKEKSSNLAENISLIGNIADVEWIFNNTHYTIYKNAIKLMIPESWNLKVLELRIVNKSYRLQDLDYEQIELDCYEYGLKALNLIPESSPTRMSLYSYEKEKILFEEKLILLPNLDIHFNAPFYYGDIERKVDIKNNDQIKELTWDKDQNEIIYPIHSGILLIKVPFLRWRINDKKWNYASLNRRIWYKDFIENGDLLEVECSKEDKDFSVFAQINDYKYQILRNQNGRFEIGRFIYANENNINISVFFSDGKNYFSLFNIATKELFITNPIICKNDTVYLNIQENFIGDKENEFLIIIRDQDKENLRKNVFVENIELGIFEENIYQVIIKIKNRNLFSGNEAYHTLFEENFIIGKLEKFRFKTKYILIESVFVRNGWIRPSKQYVIRDLVYIEPQDDENQSSIYYSGKLKIAGKDRPFINYLLNEKGEKEKINPIRIELRDKNSFWLECDYDKEDNLCNIGGLVYDNIKQEFCNINVHSHSHKITRYIPVDMFKFKEEEYV